MQILRDCLTISSLSLSDLPDKNHAAYFKWGGLFFFAYHKSTVSITHFRHGDAAAATELKLWYHEIHRHLALAAPELEDHRNPNGVIHGVNCQYLSDVDRWKFVDFIVRPFKNMLHNPLTKVITLDRLPLPAGKNLGIENTQVEFVVFPDKLLLRLELRHPSHEPYLRHEHHFEWAMQLMSELEIPPLEAVKPFGEILFASAADFDRVYSFLALHEKSARYF